MLTETARILARRWSWAAASLVLALVLGTAAYIVVAPSQNSTATVLLVPPSTQPGVVGRTNPFYSLGGSTLVMTTVVQVLVTDEKTSTRLVQNGFSAKYQVTPNLALNSGPSLLVKVDDKSATMAQATLSAVLRELRDQLETVQTGQGVTQNLLIRSVVLTQSTHPSADHKDQIQSGAIATVAALFIFLTLILLVERRQLALRPSAVDEQTETDPGPVMMSRTQRTTEPSTGALNLAGPRSGTLRAHRKTRVSPTARRRIGGANRPSRFRR